MIRECAGARERALDRPQAVHLVAAERRTFGATAASEVAAVTQAGRMLDENVAIEGENGLGLVELGERAQCATERELGARAFVVPRHRLVLGPLRARHGGEHLLLEGSNRRRRGGFRKNANSARLGGHRLASVVEPMLEAVERRAVAILHRSRRAIRIVDVQDAALRERRATAVTSGALHDAATREWMLGIAVDLDRTAFVGRDEQCLRCTGEFEHRGVLLRIAGNHVFRTARERDDLVLFVAMATRARNAGKRETRAHQLEKITTRQRIGPVGVRAGAGWKLIALVALIFSCALELGETAPVTAVVDSDGGRRRVGSSVGGSVVGAVVVVHGRHPGRPGEISGGAS